MNASKLGFGLTDYVSIQTSEHSGDWLSKFSNAITHMPEAMEFHRMAGDVDHVLKVVVPNIDAFDQFYKSLIGSSAISKVTSRFSMEKIKETTELPI